MKMYNKYYINRQDKDIPLNRLRDKIFKHNFLIIFLTLFSLISEENTYLFLSLILCLTFILLFFKEKMVLEYIDYKKIIPLSLLLSIGGVFYPTFFVAEIIFFLILFFKKIDFFYEDNEIEEWIIDFIFNKADINFKNFATYKININNDVRNGFILNSNYCSFSLESGKYYFAIANIYNKKFKIEILNNTKLIFKKDSDALEDGWNELIIDGGKIEIKIDGEIENVCFQIPKKIKKSKNPKNIILIVSDALTKNDMSIYGGDIKVPHIEQFFKNGLKFNNYYCQGEWTTTNFIHMLTGLYSSIHKSTHRFLNNKKEFTQFNTISSILQDNGFNTFFYSSSKRMGAKFGYTKGFDKTIYKGYREVKNCDITYEAINYLEQHKDENNFLVLHYMDNHAPYKHWSYMRDFNTGLREKKIDDIYRKDKEFYEVFKNSIREFDLGIGILFAYLNTNLKNADVILTSDHGQFIDIPKSDKIGSIEPLLSNMMLNIPLLIKSNKISNIKEDNEFAEAIDLFDTIKEIAEIKPYKKSLLKSDRNKNYVITESIYEGVTQRVIRTKEYVFYRKFEWLTKKEEIKILDIKSNEFIENSKLIKYFENIENKYNLMQKEDDYKEFYGEFK
jgi:arylsulfatase A-like enzyme